MIRTCTLTLVICLLAGLMSGGEEGALPVTKELEKLYCSLPSMCAREQFEPVYRLMLSNCELSVQKSTMQPLQESGLVCYSLFGSAFEFSPSFLTKEIHLHQVDRKLAPFKVAEPPTAKWFYMRSAFAWLAMQGKAKEGVSIQPEWRKELAIKIYMQLGQKLVYMPRPCLQVFRVMDEMFERDIAKFEEEFGCFGWYREQVGLLLAQLEVAGDTLYEQLKEWQIQLSNESRGTREYWALISWFFREVKAVHILKSEAFTVPLHSKGLKSVLVRHYGKEEVFGSMTFTVLGDELADMSLHEPQSLLVAYMFYSVMDEYLSCKRIPNGFGTFAMSIDVLKNPELMYLVSQDVCGEAQAVVSKVKAWARKPWAQQHDSGLHTRFLEEFDAGSVWLPGSYTGFLSESSVVGRDFVYPLLYVINHEPMDAPHIPSFLNREGYIEWQFSYFADNEHGDLLKIRNIEKAVAEVNLQRDIDKIVSDGWRERFLQGTGVKYRETDNEGLCSEFSPCIYYRFARSKVRIHGYCSYFEDIDYCYNDRAMLILEVAPYDGDLPSEAKVGLIHNSLRRWDACSVGYCKDAWLWSKIEYSKDAGYRRAHTRAMEIIEELGRDTERRARDRAKLLELLEQ